MKAKAKLHRYLQSKGFGYFAPTYVRLNKGGLHGESVQIDRHKPGLTIELGAFYICYKDVFPAIEPGELSGLWTNGRVSGISSTHQTLAFWEEKNVDSMIDAIDSIGMDVLDCFGDPELMIKVNNYLMGESRELDSFINKFPALAESGIYRAETPQRILNKVAYLNLAGRFSEAKKTTERYSLSRSDFFYKKLLEDAKHENIIVPQESLEFLWSINAAPK